MTHAAIYSVSMGFPPTIWRKVRLVPDIAFLFWRLPECIQNRAPYIEGVSKVEKRLKEYRKKAEELRALAAHMHDPDSRGNMLDVAENYMRLATSLRARVKEKRAAKKAEKRSSDG